MCGIAGAISKNKLDQNAMQIATDKLLHRGPDAGGYYLADNAHVFLGHRRLSIIDLSAVANQPMHSKDGRYAMIYNGEVYNFNELRSKLPAVIFNTHSDTEVILELFIAYGAQCFNWLNGMFAVAIHDMVENTVYIARDQVGIKPIFYYQDGNNFIFGSELKVITTAVNALQIQNKLAINHQAIPFFLHLGYIPEPYTIFENIHKFPAAHYAKITVENLNIEFHKFWNAADYFLTHPMSNEAAAEKKYKDILFEVVNSQMVSDVPLGTFLSGGIDSSLVTAAATKIAKQKVNTFSIGFNENKYDESPFAEAIAKHLGTAHCTFKVSVNDVMELIPKLLDVYDEPYADSSAFPTMLVSKLARKHVTVTLSGDGGDEIFQGYGMYTWAQRLQQPLLQTFRKPIYHLSQQLPDRYKRAGTLLNFKSKKNLHSHIFSQEQYFFSENELDNLLCIPKYNFNSLNNLSFNSNSANAAEKQAFWDFNNYLKDDLLVKVDRASMQYSLETRVPLLDLRIVEFGLNLDYNLKINPETGTKYLMKKVLYQMVPKQLFDRPKRGFAIPLKEWLKGPLNYLIQDNLSKTTIEEFGVVKFTYVNNLVKQFNAGNNYLYNRIWLLVVLHWWLKNNSIKNGQ
jgi:asparagine synthase (glutamine-hydrolysing)